MRENDCLISFIMETYPKGFIVPTVIFKGDLKEENIIDWRDPYAMNILLKLDDTITIIHRPQGIEIFVAAAVAIVASIILAPSISPPPTPENPNFPKTRESPNNSLTGQANVARPLSRIPDIYGRMRVYPDLGAKTATEYISHIKHATEYLIIGRGEFDVDEMKSTDTLLDDISGSNYTIYRPYELIPEILNVTESNEVNGQEIKASNDVESFDVFVSNVTFNIDKSFNSLSSTMSSFSRLSPGDQFDIAGTLSNDGTYTLSKFTVLNYGAEPPDFEGESLYTVEVEETLVVETVALLTNFTTVGGVTVVGPYVVSGSTEEIWIDFIAPRGIADRRSSSSISISISMKIWLYELDSADNIVNTESYIVTMTDNTLDQRFYTFKIIPANTGAKYRADVTRISSTVNDSSYYDTIKWAKLTGVSRVLNFDQGNVTSVVLTTAATDQATQSQQRKFNAIVTRKLLTYNTTTDLIVGSEVKIIIATASFETPPGTITVNQGVSPAFTAFNDLIAGDKFSIINSNLAIHDGNYTFVSIADVSGSWVVTVEEDTVLKPAEEMEFRILPNLTASTRMADALMNHLVDPLIGNKSVSDLDLDELYAIQEILDVDAIYGSVLGRFSYSFSSDKASVKDELMTISNACRCFVKKVGHRLEFGRDEINPTRTTLFNGRNKKPDSEKKTIKLQKPTDFDGVELQWVYENTGEAFTIHLPDNQSALNPKKIDAAGIKNFKQAWNRASIEFKKLKLQREFVDLTITKEGLHLQVSDRVANADGTDINSQFGELKNYSESPTGTYLTYDAVDFKGEADATVIFRNEDSSITSEHTVTPRGDSLNGFFTTDSIPFDLKIRGEDDYQIGTLFVFMPNTTGDVIKDYLVQKITPRNDDYVGVKLVNYTSDIYDADTTAPPEHETTLMSIEVDVVPSYNSIPNDHSIELDVAIAETLAWNAAPTATYTASSDAVAREWISFNAAGGWSAGGAGTISVETGGGDYRPGNNSDITSYEYLLTVSGGVGGGQSKNITGTLGSWTSLTGVVKVEVVSSNGGIVSGVNMQIREIATPSNTTGAAAFNIEAVSEGFE